MKTNLEKIRSMSAEELAAFLCDTNDCTECAVKNICHTGHTGWYYFLIGTMSIEELEEE